MARKHESGEQNSSDRQMPPQQNQSDRQPPLRFPWGVFFVSLFAFPVSYVLSLSSAMEDSRWVFVAGVGALTAMLPLTYLCVVRGSGSRRDIYFYIFTLFAFTSMVDLALALTIDGHTSLLLFYCREGEVYLTTAHGLWINYWDGSFHYACYLLLTVCLLRGDSYAAPWFRVVGLIWGGSILNSMICLFTASAVGTHAQQIKPSYLLNIPYGLFPLIFVGRVWRARPETVLAETPASRLQLDSTRRDERKPLWVWPIDALLIVAAFLCSCICVLRALVVLRSRLPLAEHYGAAFEPHLQDPTAYPTLQMLTYFFYLVPYLAWACLQLWSGVSAQPLLDAGAAARFRDATQLDAGSARFRDVTLLVVGALLQGSFSYVGAALHEGGAFPHKDWRRQSTEGLAWWVFVGVNAVMLLTPILILVRVSIKAARNQITAAPDKDAARAKTQ